MGTHWTNPLTKGKRLLFLCMKYIFCTINVLLKRQTSHCSAYTYTSNVLVLCCIMLYHNTLMAYAIFKSISNGSTYTSRMCSTNATNSVKLCRNSTSVFVCLIVHHCSHNVPEWRGLDCSKIKLFISSHLWISLQRCSHQYQTNASPLNSTTIASTHLKLKWLVFFEMNSHLPPNNKNLIYSCRI